MRVLRALGIEERIGEAARALEALTADPALGSMDRAALASAGKLLRAVAARVRAQREQAGTRVDLRARQLPLGDQ